MVSFAQDLIQIALAAVYENDKGIRVVQGHVELGQNVRHASAGWNRYFTHAPLGVGGHVLAKGSKELYVYLHRGIGLLPCLAVVRVQNGRPTVAQFVAPGNH